jgi:Zn ribbon nucleic-acid-binding protein
MEIPEVKIKLNEGKRIWRSSISKGHWLELDKAGNIIVAGKRGPFPRWDPTQKDWLADDYELLDNEKITKVEFTREVRFKAECPSCLTLNTIEKSAIESISDTVIECVNCGYEFGIKKDKEEPLVI